MVEQMTMMEQVAGNWLCWAILIMALVCYQQLWLEYFTRHNRIEDEEAEVTDDLKREFSGTLIGVLPLMGLLGTIIGLLDVFAGISVDGASSELVSGGIADALITTQLGLICAIPGWLLQAFVRAKNGKAGTQMCDSVIDAERG